MSAVLPGGRGTRSHGALLVAKSVTSAASLVCVRVLQRSLPPLPKVSIVVLQ